jgi:FixJ family two-component response regulator
MDAAERKDILSRYLDHARRFDEAAARHTAGGEEAEVIPLQPPLRELEQEPTMREIEVLQLISDGLVNREIGQRLYLSEVARTPPARQAPSPEQGARGRNRVQTQPDRLSDQAFPHLPQPVDRSLR